MAQRDDVHRLGGHVQLDDAYLGGEHAGGKPGRGSENKVPFVAALSLGEQGQPRYLKLTPVAGFTHEAIEQWACAHLHPGVRVASDGLACFTAVREAGCKHQPTVVGSTKPRDLPQFKWVNTVLGNLKTSLSGTHHAFKFAKYAAPLPRSLRLPLQPTLRSARPRRTADRRCGQYSSHSSACHSGG